MDLIGHDGKEKRVHNATITAKRDVDISLVIFKEGTNFTDEKGPSAKDLTSNLRVWFKIIWGASITDQVQTVLTTLTQVRKSCYFFWKRVLS